MIAERRGLSDDKLATIVAGQRPADLARDEAIAYDVASALVDHGVLPEQRTAWPFRHSANTAPQSSSIWLGSIALYPSRSTDSTCRYQRRAPRDWFRPINVNLSSRLPGNAVSWRSYAKASRKRSGPIVKLGMSAYGT